MNVSTRSITSTQRAEFEELARGPHTTAGYRWISRDQLPSAVPQTLRRKMPRALLMWERKASGDTYLVCNGLRVDPKVDAVDQEPFGLVVHSSGANTGGVFIHHGGWRGRTTPLTPELRTALESTCLADYFPLAGAPSTSSGPLSDLSRTQHAGAFAATLAGLIPPST